MLAKQLASCVINATATMLKTAVDDNQNHCVPVQLWCNLVAFEMFASKTQIHIKQKFG